MTIDLTSFTLDSSLPPTTVMPTTVISSSVALPDPLALVNSVLPSAGLSSSSTAIADVINALDEVQGSITLDDGILATDLTTPFGSLQDSVNLVALASDFNTSFQTISGILTFANGTASGKLIVDDEEFIATDMPFAALIADAVADFVSTFEGTVPFANGAFAIDIPTALGDVEGTIGFGSGALIVNLTTPVAPLNFSLDFPDDAQFDLPIPQLGTSAVLNLASGLIEADLIPFLPGTEFSLPINSLAGTVTFVDGIADLQVNVGFISVNTQFDVATEVAETITEFLSSASGTLGIGDGQLTANLQTGFGDFAGVLPVSQFINDWIETLPQYEGSLVVEGGIAIANIITPAEVIQGFLDYGSYLDSMTTELL